MSTDGRRDRTGELAVQPDEDTPVPAPRTETSSPPCGCDRGWLDYDADHPIPCPRCEVGQARLARLHRPRRGGWDVR